MVDLTSGFNNLNLNSSAENSTPILGQFNLNTGFNNQPQTSQSFGLGFGGHQASHNQQFSNFQGPNVTNNSSQVPKNLITFHKQEAKSTTGIEFGEFQKAQTSGDAKVFANFSKEEAALFDLSGLKQESKKEEKKTTEQPQMYGAMNLGMGGFGPTSSNQYGNYNLF